MLDQTLEELREYVMNSKTNNNRESKTGNKEAESLSSHELIQILEEDTMSTEELNEAVENDGESQSCCNVLQPAANNIEGLTVGVRESFFSRITSSLSMNYKTLFKKQGSVCLTESNICEIAKKMEYGILSTAKDLSSYHSLGAEAVINIVKQTCNGSLYESLHNEIELLRLREQMQTAAGEDAEEVPSIFTAVTQPFSEEVQSSFTTNTETFSEDHQENLDIALADTQPFICNESQVRDNNQSNTEPMAAETLNNKPINSPDSLNTLASETEYYSCSSDSCFVDVESNSNMCMVNSDIQSKNNNNIEKVIDKPGDEECEIPSSNGKSEFNSASTHEDSQKEKLKRKLECASDSSMDCSASHQNEVSEDSPKKKQKQTTNVPTSELPSDNTTVANNNKVENSESHLKYSSEVTSNKDKNAEKSNFRVPGRGSGRDVQDPPGDLPGEKDLEEMESIAHKNSNYIEKVADEASEVSSETSSSKDEFNSASTHKSSQKNKRKRKLECDLETSSNCSAIQQNEVSVRNPKKKQKQTESEPAPELPADDTTISDHGNVENSESHFKDWSEVISDKDRNAEETINVDNEISQIKQELPAVDSTVTNNNNIENSGSNRMDCSEVTLEKDKNAKKTVATVKSEFSQVISNIMLEPESNKMEPLSPTYLGVAPSFYHFCQKENATENTQNSSYETADKINHYKIDPLSDKKYWPDEVRLDILPLGKAMKIHEQVLCQLKAELDLSQYSLRIDDQQNIDQKFWDNIPLQNEHYKSIDEVFGNVFEDSLDLKSSIHENSKSINEALSNTLEDSTLLPNPVHNLETVHNYLHENSRPVDEVLSNALTDITLVPNPVYNPKSVDNSLHENSSPVDEVLSNALEGSTTAHNPIPYLENATLPSVDTSTDSNKKTGTTRKRDYCPIDDETFALYEARLVKLSKELKNRPPEVDEKNDDDVIHDDYKKAFGIILPIIRKYYPSEYIPDDWCYGQVLQRLQIDLTNADDASDDELAKYVEDSIKDRRYLLDNCIVQ